MSSSSSEEVCQKFLHFITRFLLLPIKNDANFSHKQIKNASMVDETSVNQRQPWSRPQKNVRALLMHVRIRGQELPGMQQKISKIYRMNMNWKKKVGYRGEGL